MATRIIEEPTESHVIHEHYENSGGNSLGLIVGLVLLFILGVMFIYYVLPILRSTSSPTVNVPDRVDVNLKTTK